MRTPRILIISHDATRTGAPILLLNLYEVLKEKFEVEFLLKHGGVLQSHFSNTAKTYTVAYNKKKKTVIGKSVNKLFDKTTQSIAKIPWSSYQLVISNTITNGDILPLVKRYYKGKIISYVHELEIATKTFTSKTNLQAVLKYSDAFCVPSAAVQQHLHNNLKVNAGKIYLLPYYINKKVNKQVKVENPFIHIGGVGTADWRKGIDIFIAAAAYFIRTYPGTAVHFTWLGIPNNNIMLEKLQYEARLAGISNQLSFVKETNQVEEVYNTLDILLLTSREDPYPLVVLEAANFKMPTICFKNTGGANEFVAGSGAGKTVEYLNFTQVANAIQAYAANRDVLKKDGQLAYNYFKEQHMNKAAILQQFQDLFSKYTNP
ncbi:MAG TPA: glycosyltransferase family 4 protein [Ferruginibacter sp.]|nr:glycosyltransferase family 4 protein [Ferruginibacter sp.]HMP21263.1 glycosyltransferase family 4 protein [Ferruginibacter sp.]